MILQPIVNEVIALAPTCWINFRFLALQTISLKLYKRSPQGKDFMKLLSCRFCLCARWTAI